MQFLTVAREVLTCFKGLLAGLSDNRSLSCLSIIVGSVAVASRWLLYVVDSNVHSLLDGIRSAWVTTPPQPLGRDHGAP